MLKSPILILTPQHIVGEVKLERHILCFAKRKMSKKSLHLHFFGCIFMCLLAQTEALSKDCLFKFLTSFRSLKLNPTGKRPDNSRNRINHLTWDYSCLKIKSCTLFSLLILY